MKESRLGKGLSSFFENKPQELPVFNQAIETNLKTESLSNDGIKYIPIGNIIPNKDQPRKTFKEEQLRDLAQSIEKNGVLQPILVRKSKNQTNIYEIIAGERRWRAANLAGIYEIPSIIKDFDDKETFEIGLIENLQRENLSPIEEASGYKKLIAIFNYTQEDVAKIMNKSRAHIANMLRLLTLPKEVQEMVEKGDISYSIARSLVGTENPLKTAKSIVKNDMTVKDAENIIKPSKNKSEEKSVNPEIIALKDSLSNTLNANVDINIKSGKGEIIIKFKDLNELNNITTKINNI